MTKKTGKPREIGTAGNRKTGITGKRISKTHGKRERERSSCDETASRKTGIRGRINRNRRRRRVRSR